LFIFFYYFFPHSCDPHNNIILFNTRPRQRVYRPAGPAAISRATLISSGTASPSSVNNNIYITQRALFSIYIKVC